MQLRLLPPLSAAEATRRQSARNVLLAASTGSPSVLDAPIQEGEAIPAGKVHTAGRCSTIANPSSQALDAFDFEYFPRTP